MILLSCITDSRLAIIISVPEGRGLLASLWGSALIIITTDTQDLRAAKAVRVVVGDVDGVDGRSTTCPFSASVAQLSSQRRNEPCARSATRVGVVRAVFTLANIDRADKAVAGIGAAKASVGRAVVQSTTCPSTTCPYAAGGASLTPVTAGIAFCYASGAQPAAVVVAAIVTRFCVAGRW